MGARDLDVEGLLGEARAELSEQARVEAALREHDDFGFADGSERKRLAARVREAEKMEAVGRLAAGFAHEFNNLLMVMTGFNELLLLKTDPSDMRHRYAGEVHLAAGRAATLVRQLLAFGGRQLLAPQALDLDELVATLQPLLRRRLGSEVRLEFLPGSAPARVDADPGQLEQVLLHLAANARDAMANGGTVTVTTRVVALGPDFGARCPEAQPGPHVLLSVADTGDGMDTEIQSRAFEPFFTTREFGARTGLGLATVYGIVRQSGGHIELISAPGEGATFNIYLPALPREALAPLEGGGPAYGIPAAALSEDAGQGAAEEAATILVAEDEDMVRDLIQEILEDSGYQVQVAADGVEAARLAGEQVDAFHLLVADVVMPGLNGPQLAERLRGLNPTLRVLFISGYADVELAQHNLRGPGVSFLRKPFTPDTLTHRIRELLA